jgi:hypothetical protein
MKFTVTLRIATVLAQICSSCYIAASSPAATSFCNFRRTCRQLALHPRSKCHRQQRPSCGCPSCQCGCWRARSCTSQAWCLTTQGGEGPRTPGSGCAQATHAAVRIRKGRQAGAVSIRNSEWDHNSLPMCCSLLLLLLACVAESLAYEQYTQATCYCRGAVTAVISCFTRM